MTLRGLVDLETISQKIEKLRNALWGLVPSVTDCDVTSRKIFWKCRTVTALSPSKNSDPGTGFLKPNPIESFITYKAFASQQQISRKYVFGLN
ncbi:hypothetical protein Bhyg_06451 [Pseudolycoriella hygida]|uniref:Uncharacterized protein n=1 Tax=Pseudolycoriella hygida TaxID=35572 RepID=A0A9Q0N0N8_9DIPT|nr:hypothetical protein Bhyg_06451 [Pseudolycoriella hygida]